MMTYRPLKLTLIGFTTITLSQSLSWNFTAQSSLVTLGQPAFASERSAKVRYKPPSRTAPKRTDGTGSRGCEGSLATKTGMIPLVPDGVMGLTTAKHPTFFWYMPTATPVQFVLIEPGVPTPLVRQRVEVASAGIVQFQLPEDTPELVPDKEYRWSLTMICTRSNRESAGPYVQSWITRVTSNPELTKQLAAIEKLGSQSERLRQQAEVYAQAGIWFDALAAISAAYTADTQNKTLLEDRFSLLEQVKLTQVISQERKRLAQQKSGLSQ
jgi:hypothetical protein